MGSHLPGPTPALISTLLTLPAFPMAVHLSEETWQSGVDGPFEQTKDCFLLGVG